MSLALKTFGSNFVSSRVYPIAPLGRFLIKAKKNVHGDLYSLPTRTCKLNVIAWYAHGTKIISL